MNLEDLILTKGIHKSLEQGACVMEMVSYLANEPWSDHPQCTCKALTVYAIRLNDSGDDAVRARLKALAPRLIGTRDAHAVERGNFFALQSITVMLPILTDILELNEISTRLRGFKSGEWLQSRDYIHSVVQQIREAAKKIAAASAADAAYAAYAASATASAAAFAAFADAAATTFADADAAAAAAADADADADADAAWAAADAAAYAAYDVYIHAADTAPENKKNWIEVKNKTHEAMFIALEQAIEIGKVR